MKITPKTTVTHSLHDLLRDFASPFRLVRLFKVFMIRIDLMFELLAVLRKLVVPMHVRVRTPRAESDLKIFAMHPSDHTLHRGATMGFSLRIHHPRGPGAREGFVTHVQDDPSNVHGSRS